MSDNKICLAEPFGEGDFQLWLRRFESCAATNGWDADARLLRLPTLRGRAFAAFEMLTLSKTGTAAQGRSRTSYTNSKLIGTPRQVSC